VPFLFIAIKGNISKKILHKKRMKKNFKDNKIVLKYIQVATVHSQKQN